MKRLPRWIARWWPYAALAVFLATTACLLSPSLEEGIAAVNAMEKRGAMTHEEADAMRDALTAAAANWWLNNLVALAGSLIGVRLMRGPARR